jgi:hypothetical protein
MKSLSNDRYVVCADVGGLSEAVDRLPDPGVGDLEPASRTLVGVISVVSENPSCLIPLRACGLVE